MLYLISQHESDNKFQAALIANMLKDGDVFKIKQKSSYQEERKEWTVPHFIISEKK